MKKVILSAAFVMATVSFAIAQFSNESAISHQSEVMTQQVKDEWRLAKLEELSAKVQEAIKAQEATCDVKTILYNEAVKQAKVTFVSKADQSEKVMVFDEEGKEVK